MLISCSGEPVNEFALGMAVRADGVGVIREHTMDAAGACRKCRTEWPCRMRQIGEESLTVRPVLPPNVPRPDAARAVAVWRGELFRGDGLRRRAEWLGRADYPDARRACWWLGITLETSRHVLSPGEGYLWGEVTAGRFTADYAEADGTVVLLGGWRSSEALGATATAFLRDPGESVMWDDEWMARTAGRSGR